MSDDMLMDVEEFEDEAPPPAAPPTQEQPSPPEPEAEEAAQPPVEHAPAQEDDATAEQSQQKPAEEEKEAEKPLTPAAVVEESAMAEPVRIATPPAETVEPAAPVVVSLDSAEAAPSATTVEEENVVEEPVTAASEAISVPEPEPEPEPEPARFDLTVTAPSPRPTDEVKPASPAVDASDATAAAASASAAADSPTIPSAQAAPPASDADSDEGGVSAYFDKRRPGPSRQSHFKLQQLSYSTAEIVEKHATLPTNLQLCDACNLSTVAYGCDECRALFCVECFNSQHKMPELRMHQRVHIPGATPMPSKPPTPATAKPATSDPSAPAAEAAAAAAAEGEGEEDEYADDDYEADANEFAEEAVEDEPAKPTRVAASLAVPPAALDSNTSAKRSAKAKATKNGVHARSAAAAKPKGSAKAKEKTPVPPAQPKPAVPVMPKSTSTAASKAAAAAAAAAAAQPKVAPPKPSVPKAPTKSAASKPSPASAAASTTTAAAATRAVNKSSKSPAPPQQRKPKVVVASHTAGVVQAHQGEVGAATGERVAEMSQAEAARAARALAEWEAKQAAEAAAIEQRKAELRALRKATVGFPDARHAGVLEHLFPLLLQNNAHAQVPRPTPALAGFRLPLTVIFHAGRPVTAYSTDADGYVVQRHWPVLTARGIVQEYLAGGNAVAQGPGGDERPVAVAYSMQPLVDAQALSAAQLHALFNVPFGGSGGGGASDPEEDNYDNESDDRASKAASVLPNPPVGNFILQQLMAPNGRTHLLYRMQISWVDGSAGDAPLKPGTAPHLALTECSNTQGPLCCKSRVGRPPVEQNIPATGYEGSLFQSLGAAMRLTIAKLGLGTPVRISAYCTYEEAPPAPASSDDSASASSRMVWYFCFADLLQLNSVDRGDDGTITATAVLPRGTPSRKVRKTAWQLQMAQKYLDQSFCAKCMTKYSPSGSGGVTGQPVMLRQVLLKWIPNRRYEYPEQLFEAILGADTRAGEVDWHKCVVSVCQECQAEIRALKTIPARTQLAPWLAAAAEEGAEEHNLGATMASVSSDSPTKAGGGGGGAKGGLLLPYLSKATVLHPDAPGFGSMLQPPIRDNVKPMAADLAMGSDKLGKRLRKARKERRGSGGGELLESASEPNLMQRKRHAIAGGQGTAPKAAHLPPGVRVGSRVPGNGAPSNNGLFPTLVNSPPHYARIDEEGGAEGARHLKASPPPTKLRMSGLERERDRERDSHGSRLPVLSKRASGSSSLPVLHKNSNGNHHAHQEEKQSTPLQPMQQQKGRRASSVTTLPQGVVSSAAPMAEVHAGVERERAIAVARMQQKKASLPLLQPLYSNPAPVAHNPISSSDRARTPPAADPLSFLSPTSSAAAAGGITSDPESSMADYSEEFPEEI